MPLQFNELLSILNNMDSQELRKLINLEEISFSINLPSFGITSFKDKNEVFNHLYSLHLIIHDSNCDTSEFAKALSEFLYIQYFVDLIYGVDSYYDYLESFHTEFYKETIKPGHLSFPELFL